jgi:hypothetical protein
MRRPLVSYLAIAACLAIAHAHQLGAQTGNAAPVPSRRWLPATWGISPIVAPAMDNELEFPLLLGSTHNQVVVLDYGPLTMRSYSPTGKVNWQFGRKGSGPWEFRNIVDLQVDAAGRIWLLDAVALRVTLVDPAGKGIKQISATPSIEKIVPNDSGGFWGLQLGGVPRDVGRFTSAGTLISKLQLPPVLDSIPRMATDMRTATDRGTGVVALFYSGHLFQLLSSNKVRELPAVGRMPTPKVINVVGRGMRGTRLAPGTQRAIRSITAGSGRLYVLAGAPDSLAGRLIDVYNLQAGTYEGSYRLPREFTAITVLPDGGFAATVAEPMPGLFLLRKQR